MWFVLHFFFSSQARPSLKSYKPVIPKSVKILCLLKIFVMVKVHCWIKNIKHMIDSKIPLYYYTTTFFFPALLHKWQCIKPRTWTIKLNFQFYTCVLKNPEYWKAKIINLHLGTTSRYLPLWLRGLLILCPTWLTPTTRLMWQQVFIHTSLTLGLSWTWSCSGTSWKKIKVQFVDAWWYCFNVINVQPKLENSNIKFPHLAYL